METEEKLMIQLQACRECDICRTLMDDSACLFFNELYRLFDNEDDKGEKITSGALQNLVELCNFCAICPCPNIRAALLEAKTEFKERVGLNYRIRILEDVERMGKLCGMVPGVSNFFMQNKTTGNWIKKFVGIHEACKIPEFPRHHFQAWAKSRNIDKKSAKQPKRKIAYFAGCTGIYIFPEIPKAVAEVLKRNGIELFFPEQQCCGMPFLLEGDRQRTLECVRFNVAQLAELVEEGFDIVCSCPTCGYVLKHVIREGAVYAADYQAAIQKDLEEKKERLLSIPPVGRSDLWMRQFASGSSYKLFKDDQYFSSISGLKRMRVSDHTYDLGEYLKNLYAKDALNTSLGSILGNAAYYPPCHLREQNIGEPYMDLLGLVPGISVSLIAGDFHCCGNAGIMGFKSEFHRNAVKMGSRLKATIKQMAPEQLLTDCLSCRMQFNQTLPYPVHHPIEILEKSYAAHEKT
ncbi:MAG: FeS-binding protein [Deltaproteobacteria bacterium]|nr:FeS-binding protein [Deltaproteobacteria bacterium]